MITIFKCTDCDSAVSFNSTTIENVAHHTVECPHCGSENSNEHIDSVGNATGNRYRRKTDKDGMDTCNIIRNEPVEDVNHTRNHETTCSNCKKTISFSPTKINSTIIHTVRCTNCGVTNTNEIIDNLGIALGNRFIIVNGDGKLIYNG